MSRTSSLAIALLGAILALWAAAAGAHDGARHAPVHASADEGNLPRTIATRTPRAPASVTGAGSCPSNGGGACCCQVDRAASPEPRLLVASATHSINRRPPALAQPIQSHHGIAAAPFHPVGAMGSRGPPASA